MIGIPFCIATCLMIGAISLLVTVSLMPKLLVKIAGGTARYTTGCVARPVK